MNHLAGIDNRMMLGELNPCGGGDAIPLTQPRLLIGRRSRCDITLPYKNISNQHCELELKNGYWYVRDLGSTNGVKVNGVRVETKCLLPGDEVSIARHAFRITYNLSPDAAPPEEENPFEMSLMEKAGLDVSRHRRERQPQADRPAPEKRAARTRRDSKDDFLMEWLSDE